MQRNDVRCPVEITCCKVNEILNDEKKCKEISTKKTNNSRIDFLLHNREKNYNILV